MLSPTINKPEAEGALQSREEAVLPLSDGVGVALHEVEEVRIPPNNETLKVGGRLVHFKREWTFDPWAHGIVSQGLGRLGQLRPQDSSVSVNTRLRS